MKTFAGAATAAAFAVALMCAPASGLVICAEKKGTSEPPCLEILHTEGVFSAPLPFNPKEGIRGPISIFKERFCGAEGDALKALAPHVEGRIAVVERGDCTFEEKALNAQSLGAVGLVVFNSQDTSNLILMGGDENEATGLTIPAVFISGEAGEMLIEYVEAYAREDTPVRGLLFAADDADMFWGLLPMTPMFLGLGCIAAVLFLGAFLSILKRCLCGRRAVRAPAAPVAPAAPRETTVGAIIVGVPVEVKATAPAADTNSLGTPLLKEQQGILLV